MACIFLKTCFMIWCFTTHSTGADRSYNAFTLKALQCLDVPSWRREHELRTSKNLPIKIADTKTTLAQKYSQGLQHAERTLTCWPQSHQPTPSLVLQELLLPAALRWVNSKTVKIYHWKGKLRFFLSQGLQSSGI